MGYLKTIFQATFIAICLTSDMERAAQQAAEKIFAINHVNVIPMTLTGDVVANATVIISNERIVSLDGPIPKGAEIIDGKGKWLMPGLIDMHVHVPTDINLGSTYPTKGATIFFNTQDVMMPFIANGVTTIFDLNSRPEHFGQRTIRAMMDDLSKTWTICSLLFYRNRIMRPGLNTLDRSIPVRRIIE